MSDGDLIIGSLDDPHVFEQVVTSLGPRVHAYLARRAPQHADDLLSEAWLEAFRSRRQYDASRGTASAWVFGVARHVLMAHLRSSSRAVDDRARGDEQSVDEWDIVDRRLDAVGLAPALREALTTLPAEEREVLLLVAWEQLTPSEAAAALGIPAGTARSRLHRARTRISDSWNTIAVARGGQS